MPKPPSVDHRWDGRIEIYDRVWSTSKQRYRWRYRYNNGLKGPNGGQGFESKQYAEANARALMPGRPVVDLTGQK